MHLSHVGVPFILHVLALICFVIATFNLPKVKINLIAAGLAFWVLTFLI